MAAGRPRRPRSAAAPPPRRWARRPPPHSRRLSSPALPARMPTAPPPSPTSTPTTARAGGTSSSTGRPASREGRPLATASPPSPLPSPAHPQSSVSYTIPRPHTASVCNSDDASLPLTPNPYITMAVSGPCHLATATRYMIGCATDSGSVSWGTTTGGNIAYMGTSYATLWPTVLSQTGINAGIVGRYLTVTATPGTVVPACGPSDGNCPTTVPALSGTLAGLDGRANQTLSCATGAAAGGYTVRSISAYVGAATAGKHLQCSLYDTASPHARIGAGCDTVAATLVSPTNAYVTMATSGSCHVAASTRYTIVCNSDDAAAAWGYSASCPTCSNYDVQTYGTWPATLAASTAYGSALMYYMTVTSP